MNSKHLRLHNTAWHILRAANPANCSSLIPFPRTHQVVLVRWNEPFQKLATCDTDGGIFVWIQYEGRWSVELVNDRGAQVGYTAFHINANMGQGRRHAHVSASFSGE